MIKKNRHFCLIVLMYWIVILTGCGGGGDDASDLGNINRAPVAITGNNQYVELSEVVNLNGTNSFDVDNDTLTYTWTFASKPDGSSSTISSPSSAIPTFIADTVGIYVVSLVVNDGTINSTNTATVSITAIDTNSFQYPFKISNWNVEHGDNRWGNNGCSIYSDTVKKTTDDGYYYTGFGAYTGSPFKIPPPGTYNTRIKIIPHYEWAGQRTLNSSEFTGLTNFEVDDVIYFYRNLDSQESINIFLTSMAAGQTLSYTYFTDLVYYPTIHDEISLDGFKIAKKAFEYCIQNNPN